MAAMRNISLAFDLRPMNFFFFGTATAKYLKKLLWAQNLNMYAYNFDRLNLNTYKLGGDVNL